MVSALVLARGKLPDRSAFDVLSYARDNREIPVWPDSAVEGALGDLILDYPYNSGYQGIGGENALRGRDPHGQIRERSTRENIERVVAAITASGDQCGFTPERTRWILTELLQNATTHGALSDTIDYAGLLRVAWRFESEGATKNLTIAVSNPVPRLFNPARYCNLSMEEFCAIAEQGGSGHVAVSVCAGYLSKGHKLHYLWDLPGGSRIECRLAAYELDDPSAPSEENTVLPMQVEVSKYDPADEELPYTLEQFLSDVQAEQQTEAVTVAGVFANG